MCLHSETAIFLTATFSNFFALASSYTPETTATLDASLSPAYYAYDSLRVLEFTITALRANDSYEGFSRREWFAAHFSATLTASQVPSQSSALTFASWRNLVAQPTVREEH